MYTIETQIINSTSTAIVPSNVIKTQTIPSIPAESREFVIDSYDERKWTLNETNGPLFSKNILDLIDLSSVDQLKGVHIFCTREKTAVQDKLLSSRFDITLSDGTNTTPLGAVSQFTLMNLDQSTLTSIDISNVDVRTEEFVTLHVVFLFKIA